MTNDEIRSRAAACIAAIKREAAGMLGVNWPLAEALVRDALREAVEAAAQDAAEDEPDVEYRPGRYLS